MSVCCFTRRSVGILTRWGTPAVAALALASSSSAQVHHSAELDGHWAAGTTYKVNAAPTGFTYFPYLGSEAPASYPVHFRLASATLGGAPVGLNEAADVAREGDRLILDRGPIEVFYDLADDSVEQSFLADVAGSDADLVLTLDVETSLQGNVDGAGLRFDGPLGGVTYSGAVVFDGTGRQAAIDTHFDGAQIQLTVPAAFLRSAEGEILVDPVFSTWSVDLRSRNQLQPDVVYDLSSGDFIYVYEDAFSAVDADIYFRVFDITGDLQDEGYFLLSSDDCRAPAVANQNFANVCLCVFTREINGTKRLWGRSRDMLSGTLNPEFQVLSIAGSNVEAPDLGGSAESDPAGRFLAVFTLQQPNFPRTTRAIPITAAGSVGGQRILGSDVSYNMDQIAVSPGSGTEGGDDYWSIVFRAKPIGGGGQEIRGAQINPNGTLREPTNLLFTEVAGVELLSLDVSDTIDPYGHPPTYMATYQRQDGFDDDVWVMTCRDNERLFRFHVQALEHSAVELDQIEPRITTTRTHFGVSYLERQGSGIGYDVLYTTFDIVEDRPAISERRAYIGDTGALWSGGCALASRYAAGLAASQFVGLGWAKFFNVAGTTSWNILGGLVFDNEPRAVGIQSQGCVGTVNSTGERSYIIVQGDNSVDQPKTLVAGGLPQISFGYFFVGSAFANVPMAGGSEGTLCLGGQVGRYSNFAMSSGTTGAIELTIDPANLPTPTGSESAMAGTGRLFQLWHRDTGTGGGVTSNFTNAALVIFR